MEEVENKELQSIITDEWVAETAGIHYAWDVSGQAGNLSLDIARGVLQSYSTVTAVAKCSGRRRQVGGYIQCPKCSTPWIAGFCQPRLLGCPRSARNIKHLLKKERRQPNKLNTLEKMQVSAFHLHKNIIEVSCLICKYKMRELCSVPVKEKPVVETKIEAAKRKKKKKRVKEANAGLCVSTPKSNTVSRVPKSVSISSKHTKTNQKDSMVSDSSGSNLRQKNIDKLVQMNINKTERCDSSSSDGKTICERVAQSIAKSSYSSASNHTTDSQPHSTIALSSGFRQGSKPGSPNPKQKKARQKKLMTLKSAMVKDINKNNSSSDKKSTLNDFLTSLF
ncbi:uncharacterized protein LOC121872738 [Homarus americanus]|uniref:uncharacterized protein LOC121872738 n=1 Tax=Homarus americanus TaxID=6706 RepID=UPI001C46CEBB|nr:uncharacterized protein LOC121872738 [Homarus americanus]XP_042231708.1 uncharacterized protein LOC121872738 [Homarus americanus]